MHEASSARQHTWRMRSAAQVAAQAEAQAAAHALSLIVTSDM
jgi:hypothetical protein